MTSIRLRTAALVAVCIKALLVVGGLSLMIVLRAALTVPFDEALAARAEALRSLVRMDNGRVELDFAGESMPRYAAPSRGTVAGEHPEYFVAWVRENDDWRLLERSESLNVPAWPPEAVRQGAAGVMDLALPAGARGRGLVIDFVPSVEHDEGGEHRIEADAAAPRVTEGHAVEGFPQVRLLVAMSRAPLDRTLAVIGWSIAAVGVALALASVLLVRWAVGRGLRPLTALSRRAQSLGPETLGTRFEAAGLPDELRPIAEQLNAMLARLQAAFEREKRFSAAASHELRTPIAELRMLLEVAASRPRSGEEWARTTEAALGVLDRAQSLGEMLLRLSRAEADRPSANAEARTEVGPILAERAAHAVSSRGGDARRIRIDSEERLLARIEAASLASIIGNLLDNALRHGAVTPDNPIRVSARSVAGTVRIDFTNSAPDLAPADIPHLFEPFWRKDPSRRPDGGFGMGLAVARALARAVGGDVEASIDAGGSLRIHVLLLAPDHGCATSGGCQEQAQGA